MKSKFEQLHCNGLLGRTSVTCCFLWQKLLIEYTNKTEEFYTSSSDMIQNNIISTQLTVIVEAVFF